MSVRVTPPHDLYFVYIFLETAQSPPGGWVNRGEVTVGSQEPLPIKILRRNGENATKLQEDGHMRKTLFLKRRTKTGIKTAGHLVIFEGNGRMGNGAFLPEPFEARSRD